MDQQQGSELQDEYSDDKKDKGGMLDDTHIIMESFDKHQDILAQLIQKRVNLLITLGLCVLISLIYHNVKQDNFDNIKPFIVKGSQREPVTRADLPVDQQQTQKNLMNVKGVYTVKRFKREIQILRDEIPDTVVKSVFGRIITVDGVRYMWRPRESQDNCYKTCKDETRIDCVRYFFDKIGRKCFIIGKNYISRVPVKLPSYPVKRKINSEANELFIVDEPPKQFTGTVAVLPEILLNSKPGMVVTYRGIPHVWYTAQTRQECYNLCRKTTLIDCDYYILLDDEDRCIMMEDDYGDLPVKIKVIHVPRRRPRTTTTPPPPPPPPPTTTPAPIIKIVHVQSKSNDLTELKLMIEKVQDKFRTAVESLHDNKQTHDTIVEGLKAKQNIVQNTISVLSDKVKNMNKVNHRLVDKINVMDSKQQTLGERVKNMAGYEQQIAGAVANVDKKVTNIDGDLNAIKLANEKVSRQLSGEEAANPEFNRQIIALRRQMIDLMSRVEINPTVLKMTKNQRVLAEALEAVDREIAINERRLAHIDESTGDWAGRLMAEEEHRKALSDAIQTLSKAVKNVRNDVTRLQNPQSAENIKKTKEIRQMRSDIDILEKSNAELKESLAHARADNTRLIRDLMNVQISTHDSKTSIFALVEANKNLALEYHQMKTDQNQMITQIQTLATVYRSVLAAVHSLELKQIQVMHQLGRDENEIRRVSTEILAAKTNAKKDQNLPLLQTMKTFQTKLLNQVDQLREDLWKLQKQIEINSQASKLRGAYKEGYQDGKLKLLHDIHVKKAPKKQVHITITHPKSNSR
ncbi:FK506-binding protein 5-like isoform X5 [Gigantopelta aegis]|uniref:FK506-binding protein 5-like isoform X4 n=1 Tax=Gigantopelta aegis TaxID=1735272 RepID=UPI001B888C41|nr:FK506-binding protein 5-like isoform X4 [Gigantopelta aegis]XP_041355076.1 FK506-binding protein 5-like isoform X5 [Gigantopelta aegis]